MSQVKSETDVNKTTDPDPLLHLHKMSTTAGVGSYEYVAVNTTAVVAVLFGVASILALLGTILLVIPVVGVILSIVAIRQIRDSNGTQTGRGIAWLGLVLSTFIAGGLLVNHSFQYMQGNADKAAIKALCEDYGKALKDKNFDDAYKLFDSAFHQRVSFDEFKDKLSAIQNGSHGQPTINAVAWNELIEFTNDAQLDVRSANAIVIDKYTTGQEFRENARFRKVGGVWLIDTLEVTFKPEGKAGRGGH